MTEKFGFVLQNDGNVSGYGEVLKNLPELVAKHGFVLLRGFDISQEKYEQIAYTLGKPIEYGFGTVLHMQPREQTDESQFTNKSMSLHNDTILNAGAKAQYLAFLCLEAPQEGAGGETLLTDNRRFFEIAPGQLCDELRSATVLYKPITDGYYRPGETTDGWIEHKAIVSHPCSGEEVLFIGLDDPGDERRNYISRFAHLSKSESAKLMDAIDGYLHDPNVLYEHAWRKNDVLILDNFLVCHGRNAFTAGQPRHLMRLALA